MADESNLKNWVETITSEMVSSSLIVDDGVNGKVVLHSGTRNKFITKTYDHLDDGLIRLKRETYFISSIYDSKKINIPQILGIDETNLRICQEFIEGIKKVSDSYMISEIIRFIRKINEVEEISNYPFIAADQVTGIEDIIQEIEWRILEENSNQSPENLFFMNKIQEEFYFLASSSDNFQLSKVFIENNLKYLLSPSDIGPHNMIFNHNGFTFIDFEFAGVDSNIKAGLDLSVHPDISFANLVDNDIAEQFLSVFGFAHNDVPKLLISFFRLKWALLIIKKSRKSGNPLTEKEKLYINNSITNI